MNMTREQALQAIKAKMDYYESDKRLRAAIETLVPELAESEDERIRKFICSVIDNLEPKDFVGVKKMDVLAWLEKQKEQDKCPEFCNGDCVGCEKQKEQKGLDVTDFCQPINPDIVKVLPDVINELTWGDDEQKEQKPIKIEVYEVGKGTTVCGQDYKCKKDYKEGNCWYIKDAIYHCSRDGYLTDQNGVSWSCTPEWFKEYIQSNTEWAEEEKNRFVSGQFLQCKLSFDEFKEGEHYWLEYIGDDMYVGRSDNILNQKFHITPRQLYTLFSQQLEEVQGPSEEEKQVSLNYEPPFDENPSDKEIIEALIKHLKEQDGFLTAINCVSTKAILSWLEKQKEQKPMDNKKVEIVEMKDFEQSVYDLCPVLGIEEAKATASELLELAKKTLLKTGKVVLASNYPEGCSFEDGFHLGYNEGFNAKEEQKPVVTHGETYHVDTLGTQQVIAGKMPQKPVEWSDEDADMLNCCISSIEEAKENRYAYKETDGDTSYDRAIDWLKSLRHSEK